MLRTVSAFPLPLTKQLFEERQWMVDPRGGGLFMGMASHNTDFLRWLTGQELRSRSSRMSTTYSDVAAANQSSWPRSYSTAASWPTCGSPRNCPAPSLPSSEVRFQVFGRDACSIWRTSSSSTSAKGDKWERIYTPERFDYLKEPKSPIRLYPHIGVMQEFVDSIREQRPPRVRRRGGAARRWKSVKRA